MVGRYSCSEESVTVIVLALIRLEQEAIIRFFSDAKLNDRRSEEAAPFHGKDKDAALKSEHLHQST